MRSKPQLLVWRQRVAEMLRRVLSPRERMELAFALDVNVSRVNAWTVAAFADTQAMPLFAVVHLSKDKRETILAELAAWGDALDRGDL